MIDVNKSLKMSQKKDREEKVKLTNEFNLITAPNDVYKLWSNIITNAAHGELFNLNTNKKFNAKEGWNLKNCMLTQEYFKFLGNLSYDELWKLAKHIFNQISRKRTYSYSKVTIKPISSILDSCYTTKEWAEKKKHKYLVKREIYKIDT